MPTDKYLIITAILLTLLSSVAATEFQYNVHSYPFEASRVVNVTGISDQDNYTMTLACARNLSIASTCEYTQPNTTTLSFFGNSFAILNFDISIPNSSSKGYVTEEYNFYLNGTTLLNQSIAFLFNITEPPALPVNISLTSITPFNGQTFGQFDTLPEVIIVAYEGTIDYGRSRINLTANGSSMNVSVVHTQSEFRIVLPRAATEGTYGARWVLVDNHGRNLTYQYNFSVKVSPPGKPISIFPEKGTYVDSVETLRVRMDSMNYTLYYMISDGIAPLGGSWKFMSIVGDTYVADINFNTAGLGAVYLKIVDPAGNILVQPTGIVSGPSFTIQFDEYRKGVSAGDEVAMEGTIRIKSGSGNTLRCKIADFIANKGRDSEIKWAITAATLRTKDYDPDDPDDELLEIVLENVYDESLVLAKGAVFEELELILPIPATVVANERYDASLECILA